MNSDPAPARKPLTETAERELQLRQRQRARERRKIFGLLVIALFILALAFFRFGKTIPWGAR